MNKTIFANFLSLCALVFGLALTGCVTTGDEVGAAPGATPAAVENAEANNVLRVGDRIKIAFGVTEMQSQEHQINEAGTITLPYIGSVTVANRTIEEVESDIRNKYVPKYFKHLNVTVTAERYFFVGGEVKNPSRQPYLSGVTVLQAIQSAGDFTDFADRKHVLIKRASGKTEIVNCKKALDNPKLDLPIYPGDTVTVPRGL